MREFIIKSYIWSWVQPETYDLKKRELILAELDENKKRIKKLKKWLKKHKPKSQSYEWYTSPIATHKY